MPNPPDELAEVESVDTKAIVKSNVDIGNLLEEIGDEVCELLREIKQALEEIKEILSGS